MKSFFEQNGGTCTKVGDYYIPDLEVPENNYEIRKYGRLRKKYLKKHRKGTYNYFVMSGKLFEHLHEVDVKAQKILDKFISEAEKTTPDKATHQMEWVGYMNNAKSCAEEVILERVVYADR